MRSSQFPVELAITRMAGAGATAIYTGFVRDLTDAKLAERERHERIARQALVVALGQTALSGLAPPDLSSHARDRGGPADGLVERARADRGAASPSSCRRASRA